MKQDRFEAVSTKGQHSASRICSWADCKLVLDSIVRGLTFLQQSHSRICRRLRSTRLKRRWNLNFVTGKRSCATSRSASTLPLARPPSRSKLPFPRVR
eukprot:2413262-Pleurochrysis_carterae.AAC.3